MQTLLIILLVLFSVKVSAQSYYLQDFTGNVKVKTNGKWTALTPSQKGMPVSKGDSIKTGAASKAILYSSKENAFYEVSNEHVIEINNDIQRYQAKSESLISYIVNCVKNEFVPKEHDFADHYRDFFQNVGLVTRGEDCITRPVSGNLLYGDSFLFTWKHSNYKGRYVFEIYDNSAHTHRIFRTLANDTSYMLHSAGAIERGKMYWWTFKEEGNGNQYQFGYFRILTAEEQVKAMTAHEELKKNYPGNTSINEAIEGVFFEQLALNQNARECYDECVHLNTQNPDIASMYRALTDSLKVW